MSKFFGIFKQKTIAHYSPPPALAPMTVREGYVIEQVNQLKPEHIDLYYYRTQHGAKCDLLLVNGLTPVMAIEIKFSSNPSLSKGFYTVMDDLKLDKGFVIVPEGEPYQLDKRVGVGSLLHFLREVLPGLTMT